MRPGFHFGSKLAEFASGFRSSAPLSPHPARALVTGLERPVRSPSDLISPAAEPRPRAWVSGPYTKSSGATTAAAVWCPVSPPPSRSSSESRSSRTTTKASPQPRAQRLDRPSLVPEQVRYARPLARPPGEFVALDRPTAQLEPFTHYKHIPELSRRAQLVASSKAAAELVRDYRTDRPSVMNGVGVK